MFYKVILKENNREWVIKSERIFYYLSNIR
jgi:hypothetical protein